jgi:hypothetical protein
MTRKPFMNPRTGAVHFPDDKESNDGTGNDLHIERDSDDHSGAGLDNFDLLSPIAQLEVLATTLERVYTLSTSRETELEQDEPLPTLGEYCLIGFHTASVDAEHAAKRLREAISRCYSAAQEIDEREYDRIGD